MFLSTHPHPPGRPRCTSQVVSSDIRTKAVAIEKATYLHSLGFNMNWASFHVVELMSTTNVKYKRVGWGHGNITPATSSTACQTLVCL